MIEKRLLRRGVTVRSTQEILDVADLVPSLYNMKVILIDVWLVGKAQSNRTVLGTISVMLIIATNKAKMKEYKYIALNHYRNSLDLIKMIATSSKFESLLLGFLKKYSTQTKMVAISNRFYLYPEFEIMAVSCI